MTTLSQYVAQHNPSGAADIIVKYGYKPQKSDATNAEILRHLINKHGQVVINDLATVHPDFDLIVSNYQVPQVIETKQIERAHQLNASGCGCGTHSNFTGSKCNCNGCSHNKRYAPKQFSYADGTDAPGQQTMFLIKREHLYFLTAVAAIGTMWFYFKGQGK